MVGVHTYEVDRKFDVPKLLHDPLVRLSRRKYPQWLEPMQFSALARNAWRGSKIAETSSFAHAQLVWHHDSIYGNLFPKAVRTQLTGSERFLVPSTFEALT